MSPYRRRRDIPDLGENRAVALAYLRERSIVTEAGCWEWQGHRDPVWQYGQCTFMGHRWQVNRLAYAAANGPFDKALDICHRCDNPPCCNPEHLWLGTPKENMQDASKKGRIYLGTLTHCKRGHPLSGDNVYLKPENGARMCLACCRARHRIRAGWPPEVAYTMPIVPFGQTPMKGKFPRKKNWRQRKAELAASRAVHSDAGSLK